MIKSMSMNRESKLRDLLGDDIVADDPDTLTTHSGDKWFAAHEPDVVVFARSTNDISKLLQFASREKVPVTARGGGFGYVGGCVPVRGNRPVASTNEPNQGNQLLRRSRSCRTWRRHR